MICDHPDCAPGVWIPGSMSAEHIRAHQRIDIQIEHMTDPDPADEADQLTAYERSIYGD